MKSIFVLSSIVGAAADVSKCQADESTLLQGRHVMRNAKTSGSHDAKAILKHMRDVTNSLVEGSDTALSEDVILDAYDAVIQPLEELSAAVLERVENARQSIADAHAGFQVCRAPDSGEREYMEDMASHVDGCHDTLEQLQTAETQQCDTAEDCLCDEARIRTADQQALCTQMTESYEAMFCVQHGRCTDAQECHSGAAEVYERLTADVEQEMRLIQEEFSAVEQALCIQRVGKEAMTPPRTSIPLADLAACDDVDVSAIHIDYPAATAPPASCPSSRNGDLPCEDRVFFRNFMGTHHVIGTFEDGDVTVGDRFLRRIDCASRVVQVHIQGESCGGEAIVQVRINEETADYFRTGTQHNYQDVEDVTLVSGDVSPLPTTFYTGTTRHKGWGLRGPHDQLPQGRRVFVHSNPWPDDTWENCNYSDLHPLVNGETVTLTCMAAAA